MEIMHRISCSAKHGAKVARKLRALGVKLEGAENQKSALLFYFNIGENDRRWAEVEKILKSAKIEKWPEWTEFTRQEIMSSEWVRVLPAHVWGYPMPDLNGGWKTLSFVPGAICPTCGIGLKQKAPIHLKGKPKLGDNDFVALFWTYTIFARPEVFDIMLRNGIRGFEVLPAIDHSSNVPLRSVKQLKIADEMPPCIIEDNLTRDTNKCDHTKYKGLSRGMYRFPKRSFMDCPDMVMTNEWFGGGHAAYQLVLASARFVNLYFENNWKGLSFQPIELVS